MDDRSCAEARGSEVAVDCNGARKENGENRSVTAAHRITTMMNLASTLALDVCKQEARCDVQSNVKALPVPRYSRFVVP